AEHRYPHSFPTRRSSDLLIGREHFFLEAVAEDEPGEIMTAFVQQYYQRAPFVPPEVLLQVPVEDQDVVEGWLRQRRGGAVRLHRSEEHTSELQSRENLVC